MRSLTLLALIASFTATAIPAAAQGSARAGPFDPRSGRFATSLPNEGSRTPDTVAAPLEKVWAAINKAYGELGIPVTVVDTELKVVGALRAPQRRPLAGARLSSILECGTGPYGPNAERYSVQLTSLSAVASVGDRTIIDTRVGGSAAPNGLNSSVSCGSTGVLEEKVLEAVRKQLGM
jgi:hypothetical protein